MRGTSVEVALLGQFGTLGQCAQAQRAIAMKHMSRIPFPSLGNTKVITGALAPRSPSNSFRSLEGCVFFCCSVPYLGVRWVGAGWSVGEGEGGGVCGCSHRNTRATTWEGGNLYSHKPTFLKEAGQLFTQWWGEVCGAGERWGVHIWRADVAPYMDNYTYMAC